MNRICSFLLTAALGAALTGGCARDGITDDMIDRGREHAATVETAERLGDLLGGDYIAGTGEDARSLHIRRLPEFSRGFYVELIRSAEPDSPLLQTVWFPVVDEPGLITIDQYHISDAEEYIGAWKDGEMLRAASMYEMTKIDGQSVPVSEQSPGFFLAGGRHQPMIATITEPGIEVMAAKNEALTGTWERITPLMTERPAP